LEVMDGDTHESSLSQRGHYCSAGESFCRHKLSVNQIHVNKIHVHWSWTGIKKPDQHKCPTRQGIGAMESEATGIKWLFGVIA
jgi:hypothetical protein